LGSLPESSLLFEFDRGIRWMSWHRVCERESFLPLPDQPMKLSDIRRLFDEP
jgi:hypothetical protein